MHLLSLDANGEPNLATFIEDIPPYAILSHTWGADDEEVTFLDLKQGSGRSKVGYDKIRFCGRQAAKDGLQYFWVDTCCIDKANLTELSEAITSMFRWYRNSRSCYVYLSDVSSEGDENNSYRRRWKPAFRKSRWFTRAWTLQELIAPKSVRFYSREEEYLGSKATLELQIHELTHIPLAALRGAPLSDFGVDERFRWAEDRKAKRVEDKAYSLLGILGLSLSLRYGEGENAFNRLKKKADISSQNPHPITYPAHWVVSRSVNAVFTGRDGILLELETLVRTVVKSPTPEKPCWITICGIGGQGKSEICLQLAHRLRQIFWGVFWVDVSTSSSAEGGFLSIAERLQIPTRKWEDALQGIAGLKEPWLLVLDNADDSSVDYQQYYPTGSLGVVVLTSRNIECQHYATAKCVHLEGLTNAEARSLLLRTARIPFDKEKELDKDIQTVAELLRSHPLALIQAGSYVARGHCTFKEYPQVYHRQRKRLLTFRPSQARSRYGDIYTTFEASADVIQSSGTESSRDALQLLPVLAALGTGLLPLIVFEAAWKGSRTICQDDTNAKAHDKEDLRLLTTWHVSHLLPLIPADASQWDPFRLIEAVNLLKSSALVSIETLKNSRLGVLMHPLVHAWAIDRLDTADQHKSWITAGILVAFSPLSLIFWQKHQSQLQQLIRSLISRDMSQILSIYPPYMIVRILVACGWQLYKMRDDARLFELVDKLFCHLGLDKMDVDSRWLELYELRARNLKDLGRIKEAVSLMEQVVKVRERTLTEDHHYRLAAQNVLARAYQANGQTKEAVTLMEHVVRINEKNLAEDDRSRLASQNVLAGAYRANGQLTKAVSLIEHVVKINEKTLGEDHHTRLASQHMLAATYQANGQVKEAVALFSHVVKMNEQNLVESHPHRLNSQYELAMAYRAGGRIKEAMQLLEHVVNIRKQTLAGNHPDRLASEQQLFIFKQDPEVS